MNMIFKIRNPWNVDPSTSTSSAGMSVEPGFGGHPTSSKFESLRRRERSAAEHPAYPYGLDIGRISS